MGFCTTCGTPLARDGTCPHGHTTLGRRRTRRWPLLTAIAGVVVFLTGVGAVGLLSLSQVSELRADLEDLGDDVRAQSDEAVEQERTIVRLRDRVEAVELDIGASLTPTEISDQARESVFTVESGEVGSGTFGTAFVLRSGGRSSLLVTNYHVVGNTWESGGVTVNVSHGDRTYPATIETVSPEEDLAVLRVQLRLDAIPVNRERPDVGDTVVVIGSALGLERTVATGVVSAYREGYLQFSAPISPGDSGAPLLNDQGEVVGVVVGKIVGEAAEGLSFAIPIQRACRFVVGC